MAKKSLQALSPSAINIKELIKAYQVKVEKVVAKAQDLEDKITHSEQQISQWRHEFDTIPHVWWGDEILRPIIAELEKITKRKCYEKLVTQSFGSCATIFLYNEKRTDYLCGKFVHVDLVGIPIAVLDMRNLRNNAGASNLISSSDYPRIPLPDTPEKILEYFMYDKPTK